MSFKWFAVEITTAISISSRRAKRRERGREGAARESQSDYVESAPDSRVTATIENRSFIDNRP